MTENETHPVFIAARVSENDAAALRALALREERSVSSLVRLAIRRLLKEAKDGH